MEGMGVGYWLAQGDFTRSLCGRINLVFERGLRLAFVIR